MGNVYGYIRVSTRDQNEIRQIIAMQEMNVPRCNIYTDKSSGKDFNRPEYKTLLRRLKSDDLIYVKSIDRLGRDYRDVMEQWRIITKVKKADIAVIDMPVLDTRIGKDLMGTFLSDIVLTVLSYVAENERDNIRRRQAEGIAAARARGVRFGRRPMPVPDEFPGVYTEWSAGKITLTDAAKRCGMARSTFYDKARRHKENMPGE